LTSQLPSSRLYENWRMLLGALMDFGETIVEDSSLFKHTQMELACAMSLE
jgi:hypothetical protein